MEIGGQWLQCSDGATRPMIDAEALRGDGTWMRESFLVDSGADRTVFSAAFWAQLKLPIDPNPLGTAWSASLMKPSPIPDAALTFEFQ